MFLIVLLILFFVTLSFDPFAYLSYHTPKNYLLLLIVGITPIVFIIHQLAIAKRILIEITIIEILLIVRVFWLVITNQMFLLHPSNLGFWIFLALIILTIMVRNSKTHKRDKSNKFLNLSTLPNSLKYFYRTVWVLGLIQAFIGFFQLYQYHGLTYLAIKTPMLGSIGSANGFGLFLTISIIAGFSDFRTQKSLISKLILMFSVAIMFIALLLNFSRGAIFSLTLTGIFIISLFFSIKTNEFKIIAEKYYRIKFILIRAINKRIFKVIGITILLLIVVLLFNYLYKINPESSSGRIMVWEISLPMLIDNPFFGVGQGNYAIEYLNYQAKYFNDPSNSELIYKAANLKQAHNEYFQAFCESGILGGVLFFLIWSIALITLIKHVRNGKSNSTYYYGLLGILTAILIHSFLDTPLHVLPITIIAYLCLGLIPIQKYKYNIRIKSKTSLVIINVIALIFLIFISQKSIREYVGYREWQKGTEFAKQLDWGNAIICYSNALGKIENKGELQFHLGSAKVLNKEYTTGVSLLKESLKNFNDRNIYISLSYAYLKLRHFGEAEEYAIKTLSMFPDHLAPHLLLGEIYFYQNKIEESKTALIKCINRDTYIQSKEVEQISRDAKILWKWFFEN